VLIAPHHGSAEVTTAAFLAAVDPSLIISSNDRTLTMKQRHFERISGNRALYRTHNCGAITLAIAPDGALRVEPFLSDPKR
jgi:beta-lactamase superfamily II metal-dependent hydrolase